MRQSLVSQRYPSAPDNRAVLALLQDRSVVTLELGCGERKRYPGSIGIDAIDGNSVDIVGDATETLRMFPTAAADFVTSCHFLEHVADLQPLLDEIVRVVKVGGRIEVVVPHFAHPYYASDPTHRNRFGLYTFSYLAEDKIMSRGVPSYVRMKTLSLESVDLVFKSPSPFYFRYGFKKLIGALFNSCRYMQELYEENFCYIFPCYEIRFVLRRVAP